MLSVQPDMGQHFLQMHLATFVQSTAPNYVSACNYQKFDLGRHVSLDFANFRNVYFRILQVGYFKIIAYSSKKTLSAFRSLFIQ